MPTQAAGDKQHYFQVYQDLIDYPDVKDYFNDDLKFPEGMPLSGFYEFNNCYVFAYISFRTTSIRPWLGNSHRPIVAMPALARHIKSWSVAECAASIY